ncbi:MAG: two-component system, OmpR family, sensor kinase [Gaiellaceae bacterium]|jgi:signal transduction histidine kinase|nr:two-component system, OmpR family, sensor kinase [Gaiellaceae bacterium]
MFSSLRFRLPALFLLGIVVSGLIAAAVALRLFQSYVLNGSKADLRREAIGLTEVFAQQAITLNDTGVLPRISRQLELATGDRLFYVGVSPFPDKRNSSVGLERLPQSTVDWRSGKTITFEFIPPGAHKTFLAVARPLTLGTKGPAFGDLIVAKPKTELNRRLIPLLERLAIASLGGIIVAGLLGWYLSRRITRPVLALSRATDEIARGSYDVDLPKVKGSGEIGHLAESFREMASRLSDAERQERNFLMSVSHELRTPLTAIRGHVDALREGVAEDPEARAASLDVIAREGVRLERLVGDVLDLAKLEADRFTVLKEEVDMERLCDQAYAAFGEEARRRDITYDKHFEAKPTILSDGDRVLQIISNLLSNAFRWTPDGGRVELELDAANGRVSVAVGDNGPGVAPEERERIFRPFWSRDDSGTGLGLAIAHELAGALGGSIELDSEPGHGSRFQLVLPSHHD